MSSVLEDFLNEADLSGYLQKFAEAQLTYEQLPEVAGNSTFLNLLIPLPCIGDQIKFTGAVKRKFTKGNGDNDDSSISRSSISYPSSTSVTDSQSGGSCRVVAVGSDHSVQVTYLDDDTILLDTDPLAAESNEPPSIVHNQVQVEAGSQLQEIRNAVSQYVDGLAVVGTFDLKKTFDNKSRVKLAHVLIRHQFGVGPNLNPQTELSSTQLKNLAQKIAKEFLGEDPLTWNTPSQTPDDGKTTIPKGKLYDQYTETCKELRTAGKRDSRKRKRDGNDRPCEAFVRGQPPLPQITLETQQIRDKIKFLETELTNWENITLNWELTVTTRQSELRDDSNDDDQTDLHPENGNDDKDNYVTNYLRRFPCLMLAKGLSLYGIDFRALYPDAYNRIFTHWDTFLEKLKAQLDIENISYERVKNDAQFLHLYAKLFPSVLIKTPRQKGWKVSRPDMLEGFLLHLKDISDLPKVLENIKKRNLSKGLRVQPFPMIIGKSLSSENISSYFVINETPFILESPREAVQTAFYAYHALYTSYPHQSARLWVVLERALYGISDPSDAQSETIAQFPEVRRLISALKV